MRYKVPWGWRGGAYPACTLCRHVFLRDSWISQSGYRVCLLERADLPQSLTRDADWSPAEIRHGKLFVDVEVDGKKLDKVFYDTGSSASALAVDFDFWKEVTGNSGTKDATAHFRAPSWGRELEIVGAHAYGDFRIGKQSYAKPLITTIPAQPSAFRTAFAAQGLMGNALFTESIIILDLGSHPRFGIVNNSAR